MLFQRFTLEIRRRKIILLISLLVLLTSFGRAQLLYDNGVVISITAGSNLSIKGGSTFAAGSSVQNNGIIDQTGDFTNNSGSNLFGTTTGTVILDGASQNINGSSSTTFNNLTLSGTGTKTLQIVTETGGIGSGVLALNDRYLDLNSKTLILKNPSNTAISRTTGFVNSETDPTTAYGLISWLTGNIASPSSYVLPFGNISSGDYLPLTLNFTTNGVGPSAKIEVATYPTNTAALPNNRPLPTGLSVLTDLSGNENAANTIDRFWVINATDFSTLPTSNLQVTYRDSEWNAGTNSITESTLLPQRYTSGNWTLPLAGTLNTATNTMLINSVNEYNSFWTLAGNANPLPIELLEFNAKRLGDKEVLCHWTTITENNNDFFIVERSRDGIHFEAIGTLDGAGNSSALLSYRFIDKNPYSGLSYYRLQQMDYDGKSTYSTIISIKFESSHPTFTMYPNPSTGDVYFYSENAIVTSSTLTVYDASGRLVIQKNITNNEVLYLDMKGYAKGIYTVKMAAMENNKIFKIVLK